MKERKNQGSAGIILVVVFAVAVIAVIVLLTKPKAYDGGTYEGNTEYTNKWAGVKINLPADYKATGPIIDTASASYRCFIKSSGTNYSILCINTDKTDASIDQSLQNLKDSFLQSYGAAVASGFNLTTKSVTTVSIAGETFKCLPVEFSNGTMSGVMNFYARRVNKNGIIMFTVLTTSSSELNTILGYIKKK